MEQRLLPERDVSFRDAVNGDDQQPAVMDANPVSPSSMEDLVARARSYRTIGLCLLSTTCTLVAVLILGTVVYRLDLHSAPLFYENNDGVRFSAGAAARSLNASEGNTTTKRLATFNTRTSPIFFNANRNLTPKEPRRLGNRIASPSASDSPQRGPWPSITIGELFDEVLRRKLRL